MAIPHNQQLAYRAANFPIRSVYDFEEFLPDFKSFGRYGKKGAGKMCADNCAVMPSICYESHASIANTIIAAHSSSLAVQSEWIQEISPCTNMRSLIAAHDLVHGYLVRMRR